MGKKGGGGPSSKERSGGEQDYTLARERSAAELVLERWSQLCGFGLIPMNKLTKAGQGSSSSDSSGRGGTNQNTGKKTNIGAMVKGHALSAFDWIKNNTSLAVAFFAVFMLFYMKAAEEGYHPGLAPDEMNPYQALGVSPSASDAEIKKVYKKLALQWHPDKHDKDCAECKKRFDEISTAYDKIGDQNKRRAFDNNRASKKEVLTGANSLYLSSREIFEKEVESTNDNWIICVYDGNENRDSLFPIFEEATLKYGHIARYAHVDTSSSDGAKIVKQIMDIKPVFLPVVVRYAPAMQETADFMSVLKNPNDEERNLNRLLKKYIFESYPTRDIPFYENGPAKVLDHIRTPAYDSYGNKISKMILVVPDEQVIPNNPKLEQEGVNLIWKGFKNTPPKNPNLLHYVQDIQQFLRLSIKYSGLVSMSSISADILLQGFAQGFESNRGDKTAENLEKLGRKIWMFFNQQKQFYKLKSKWQDLPYVVILIDTEGNVIINETLYLPSAQAVGSPENLRKLLPGEKYSDLKVTPVKGKSSTKQLKNDLSEISLAHRQSTAQRYYIEFMGTFMKAHKLVDDAKLAEYNTKYGDLLKNVPLSNLLEQNDSYSFRSTKDALEVEDDDSAGDSDTPEDEEKKGDGIDRKALLGLQDPNTSNIRIKELQALLGENKPYIDYMVESKIGDLLEKTIVVVNQFNFQELCLNKPNASNTRRMCLFLESNQKNNGIVINDNIKGGQTLITKEELLKQLAESKAHYQQDLHENQSEEENEQETRIQVVEYLANDYFFIPRKMWGIDGAFSSFWEKPEVKDADLLVFEPDVKRGVGLKLKQFNLAELHGAIAFEDLHMHDDFAGLQQMVPPSDRATFYTAFRDSLFGRTTIDFLISWVGIWAPIMAYVIEILVTKRAYKNFRNSLLGSMYAQKTVYVTVTVQVFTLLFILVAARSTAFQKLLWKIIL